MKDLYALSDKTIQRLNRLAVRRFRDAQVQCGAGLLPFDELNVIQTVRKLYADLDADNRKAFLDLAILVYKNAEPHGDRPPDEDWMDDLLLEYDQVTKYVYANEVSRKRDYTTEAVIAAVDKDKEFKRGLLHWGRFTATYSDIVTDRAVIKAFKDAGVERVRWLTEEDNRVCETCDERHGKIYPIDKIPPKPHVGCRCRLEAVE